MLIIIAAEITSKGREMSVTLSHHHLKKYYLKEGSRDSQDE